MLLTLNLNETRRTEDFDPDTTIAEIAQKCSISTSHIIHFDGTPILDRSKKLRDISTNSFATLSVILKTNNA